MMAYKKVNIRYRRAIFRDAQQEHLKKQLQAALVESNIKHIFLKGAVLKADYPTPALRTMSDLDVLVYVEAFGRIDKVSQKLGTRANGSDGNHRNYVFPSKGTRNFTPDQIQLQKEKLQRFGIRDK